ncbi:MAG: HAD-IA family hydrolase, partial [Bacteroidetes bacterium]|nr:HAD-IA family hydrolase [Bacteroidota bacterium]
GCSFSYVHLIFVFERYGDSKPAPLSLQTLFELHLVVELRYYLKDNNDFFELFDGIIFSADVKLVKPELEIYHLLCDRYHILPAESVFLDDRIENIEAARMIGIHAIHFTSYSIAEEELNKLLDH